MACLSCSSDQAVSRWRVRPELSSAANPCLGLLMVLNQRQWQDIIFYCCELAPVMKLLINLYLWAWCFTRHTLWHSNVMLYQVKQLLPQLTSKQRISINFISCVPAKERNSVMCTHLFELRLCQKDLSCSPNFNPTATDQLCRSVNPEVALLPQTVFSACCERMWSQNETSVIHFGLALEFLSVLARQLEPE